ncbi:CNIH1 family protein [Megaselia abdita]
MAFSFSAFTYIFALIGDAFLIFFSIFHVIAFDELKTDYKNPIDQCNSLNPLVLPEYLLHILINVLFLFAGEWFSLFFNVPLIAYHVWRYKNRPVMTGPGLYDPTRIMNQDNLSKNMREGWIKLLVYLLSFFYYIYGETNGKTWILGITKKAKLHYGYV